MKSHDLAKKYKVNFDSLSILLEASSPLDSFSFVGDLNDKSDVVQFLRGYGVDVNDPIEMSELFGHFQEALEFIRKHFLKPESPDGLDLKIPKKILSIVDIKELYWLSREKVGRGEKLEIKLWASLILKIMHTILHINKDLRQNYFSHIQTQIFDRFYKHLDRREGKLFLKSPTQEIEIEGFQTKSKKTRDSVVIKLLHKKESVAEELFDTIGVRIITKEKFDCFRVIMFLLDQHVIMPQNLKVSRSHNSLFDLKKFRKAYDQVYYDLINKKIKDVEAYEKFKTLSEGALSANTIREKNEHTLKNYRSIHMTCRQLIKYVNPIAKQIEQLRIESFGDESKLGKIIQSLDTSNVTRKLKFFYPYEFQVTDCESHLENSKGESSHSKYKKSQKTAAMKRLFKNLIDIERKNK